MATRGDRKRRVSGKFCVAGGPGNVSCTNNSLVPGISMHIFPSNEVTCKKWTKFVHKHRPSFKPSRTSVLCSVHFSQECFNRRLDLLGGESTDRANVSSSRRLNKGAIPTIDTAITPSNNGSDLSRRDKRKIIKQALIDEKDEKNKVSRVDQEAILEESLQIPVSAPEIEPSIEHFEHTHVHDVEAASHLQTPSEAPSEHSDCSQCSKKSKIIRKLQQNNSYLRRNVRQLRGQLKEGNKYLNHGDTTESSGDDEIGEQPHNYKPNPTSTCTETETDGDEHVDPMWNGEEDSGGSTTDDGATENTVSVEPDTPSHEEPKFVVFYTMLYNLFSMFCFKCKMENPKVAMKKNGTMVTVIQTCRNCISEPFTWQSQPYILGRYPAGNIMLSFGILMAGASASKVLLFCKHMGLSAISLRTFFLHQKKFLFPSILHHWEKYKSKLVEQIKRSTNAVWSGDGRFDSMGHSAKYGVYTMFSSTIMKVVHFELLQANETGSSQAMELEGAKRSFSNLLSVGLQIKVFISDRHRGIAKWIRENQPSTSHFYDIWHVAKSVTKQMQKASKEKGFELIKDWIKSARTHLYWCATSTKLGFQSMILAKWKSFMLHVANKHDNHPNSLFPKCAHDDHIQRRKWIKIGTKVYEKLNSLLMNTRILNDIKQLSSDAQTSCLEGFHATLNHFHPKMLCFSWLGTYCRHILASLHFNENLKREARKTKEGNIYYKVTWPKFKQGDEVVREVSVPHTYDYVGDVRNVLFSLSADAHDEKLQKYVAMVPEPLNRQFSNRLSKEEAVSRKQQRNKLRAQLFPEACVQDELQSKSEEQEAPPAAKKKSPYCKTCQQPMKGHSKNTCQSLQNNSCEK